MSEGIEPLTRSRILRLYYPLALSWVFMALEGPICVRILSGAQDGAIRDVWTAAFNALMSISLFIESPVIDLLSTSTTLCRSRQNYEMLRRFTVLIMALVTVVHALATLTPLYGVITAGFKPEVREALHLPLTLMIPWSAFIGWRRFKQGILIRHGQTRLIGIGTLLRVSVISLVGLVFGHLIPGTGVMVAAVALMCSVASEAIFVHIAARGSIADDLRHDDEKPLSLGSLAAFHFPLSGTTTLALSSMMLIAYCLAQTKQPILAPAAWQVSMSLGWLMRTITFALPEVVIALWGGEQHQATLRRFCITTGAVLSGLMAVVAMLGLDHWFFLHVVGATPATAEMAHVAFSTQVFLPLIAASQSFVRGALTAMHFTISRLAAVVMGVTTLIGVLACAIFLHWPGGIIGGAAITASALVELTALSRTYRSKSRPALIAS